MDVSTLVTAKSLHVGTAGPLLLAAWTGESPAVADIKQGTAALLSAAKGIGEGKAGFVALIRDNMPLPAEDARKAIAAEMAKTLPYVVAGVTIIPQAGFRGAAARALVSTLQLIVRVGHPERVVATSREAAGFLFGELAKAHSPPPGAGLSPAALQQAIDTFSKQAWG